MRGAPAFSGATGPGAAREPLPADIVNRIRAVEGVDQVAGMVQGYAQLLDKDGDKIGSVTSATVGGSAEGLGTISPFELAAGRAPQGAGEVVVDVATARDNGLSVGDDVTILFTGPRPPVPHRRHGHLRRQCRPRGHHLRPVRAAHRSAAGRPPGAARRRGRVGQGRRRPRPNLHARDRAQLVIVAYEAGVVAPGAA